MLSSLLFYLLTNISSINLSNFKSSLLTFIASSLILYILECSSVRIRGEDNNSKDEAIKRLNRSKK